MDACAFGKYKKVKKGIAFLNGACYNAKDRTIAAVTPMWEERYEPLFFGELVLSGL